MRQSEMEATTQGKRIGKVSERRFVQGNAAPPNKWMEPTVKSVVPFAKRRAKATPLFPAAHAGR
jgi:hypothetical protein